MYSRLATAALLTALVSCAHAPDKQGAPVKDPAPPPQNPLLVDAAMKMERIDILALLLDELGAIGFDHVAERSSYADAVAMTH
jgi:hypothetical protein